MTCIKSQLAAVRAVWPAASRVFAALWLFVIFVSVLDGYLALRDRDTLQSSELNPVGLTLIELGGGVWLLLAGKAAGTIAAASLMLLVYGYSPRIGLATAAGVAGLQLWLLLFLTLM
jgi:hypothetical protein